jgi:hypothetical protein
MARLYIWSVVETRRAASVHLELLSVRHIAQTLS